MLERFRLLPQFYGKILERIFEERHKFVFTHFATLFSSISHFHNAYKCLIDSKSRAFLYNSPGDPLHCNLLASGKKEALLLFSAYIDIATFQYIYIYVWIPIYI